ncbi:baseplate assembly protein [Halodesulfovibrio aestuarii]|uniref:Baseplate J/gp47 family protein n=1 Tax=Halodesulfovibrio aestuarii TaxID=126333 RepID=A0ABV4JTY8_9BACT
MSGFAQIDLSKLPIPDVIESINFEAILQEVLDDYYERNPDHTALLESDPAYKLAEVAAYREVLLRQRINEAAWAVMVAGAKGNDLDNLAALVPVQRLLLDAGDPDANPPVPPTYESDDDFRSRIQLAPEGFSVAGPKGAYIFHTLSVPGVKGAYVHSPAPVEVDVYVLAKVENDNKGIPDATLLQAVEKSLMDDEVRPFTDLVRVNSAVVKEYAIVATLHMLPGPSKESAKLEAQKRIEEYVAERHALGAGVPLSGIHAALHVAGVDKVTIIEPAANVVCAGEEAAWCTSITLEAANV